jgi:hypothetical protein
VVSELQSTVSDLQRTLPGLAKNMSSADASIRQTDKDSASSTPKSS